jgi:crotonobetainyl-CoA:carnitine CoA-transferase CaiB-like acyl-CoA transferase
MNENCRDDPFRDQGIGSYCGLLLGFLGAEVIKLEPPAGENLRHRKGVWKSDSVIGK